MANISIYPNAIDGYTQIPLVIDNITEINAIAINRLRDAIIKIESELGTLPSGALQDVKSRLNELDSKLAKYQSHDNLLNIEWNLGGHTGEESFLAGFNATGGASNIDPTTIATIDHSQLINVIWTAGGHTGTPSFLSGFNGLGEATNTDPSSFGFITDHSLLGNTAWNSSDHTGTINYLAGFNGLGNSIDVDPNTVITTDLATTLSEDNITGGTNIAVSSGDGIIGVDGATGTNLIIRPGNGSAGNDGSLNSGTATGATVGNSRGENAVDLQRHRDNSAQIASGFASFIAAGYGNTSSNGYTCASGYKCSANSWVSNAEGSGSTAHYGNFLHWGQHAEGLNTLAYGRYSHAEGRQTKTYGKYSHAEGYQTTVGQYGSNDGGNHAHAEGQKTYAIGRGSHAEGYGSIAGGISEIFPFGPIGPGSHAEGVYTSARQSGGHAEGRRTNCFGSASHSEGSYSEASSGSGSSHAEGWQTRCLQSDFAHAGGRFSMTDIDSQFARASDDFSATVSGKGGSQLSLFHGGERTTNSTTKAFKFGSFRLTLRASMTYGFNLIITARQTGGIGGTVGDSATWIFYGQTKRDDSNNTTLDGLWVLQQVVLTDEAITILENIVSSGAETPSFSSAGASAWTIQITADDVNEALQIAATGEDDKNIVWSVAMETAEAGIGQNI